MVPVVVFLAVDVAFPGEARHLPVEGLSALTTCEAGRVPPTLHGQQVKSVGDSGATARTGDAGTFFQLAGGRLGVAARGCVVIVRGGGARAAGGTRGAHVALAHRGRRVRTRQVWGEVTGRVVGWTYVAIMLLL